MRFQVTTYLLDPRSRMVGALTRACAAGAQVDLRLAYPTRDQFVLPRNIASAVGLLVNRAGFATSDAATAQALQIQVAAGQSPPRCNIIFDPNPLHAKVAFVDGVGYLTDENFTASGYIVRDTVPQDQGVIVAALRGQAGSDGRLSMAKGLSLQLEANLLLRATGPIAIATEAFGPGNPVADAMLHQAGRVPIRLIVAQREANESGPLGDEERALLSLLRSRGVQIVFSPENEKLAVSGNMIFLGSANATRQVPMQVDWGLATIDENLARTTLARFERLWNTPSPN